MQLNQTKLYNGLRNLLATVIKISANIPKVHRYVIGTRMQNLVMDMNRLFAESYLSHDARSLVLMNEFMADYELLNILVTFCVEYHFISGSKAAGHLVKLMASISKQASALRNSYARAYDQSKT